MAEKLTPTSKGSATGGKGFPKSDPQESKLTGGKK
jgi:hypothetical protein